MGLVQYVLKFRITFYVMSILILLAGVGVYFMMPKDVLPQVNIPVVTVVWTFTGLDTPEAMAILNEVPIKVVNGTPILIRDVAWVRDGEPQQQSIVRQDGRRGVLLTVLKNGEASTLGVVNTGSRCCPASTPPLRIAAPDLDQQLQQAPAQLGQ